MYRVFAALFLMVILCSNAAEPLFYYDFAKPGEIELYAGAQITDGTLKLDGKGAYAAIPGSGKANITDKGLTLMCVVRFNEQVEAGQDIIGKDNAILFSRSRKSQAHYGFFDGRRWHAITGGKLIPTGEWVHLAMVAERVLETSRGWNGYRCKIFINGELTASNFFADSIPALPDSKIMLGRGNAKDVWAMNGEFAEAAVYDRALSDGEVSTIVRESTKIKVVRPDGYTVSPALKDKLQQAYSAAKLPESKWSVSALERAALNGADQSRLIALLEAVTPSLKDVKTMAELAEKWNAAQTFSRIVVADKLAGMFLNDVDGAFFPLIGLYDGIGKREILASYGFFWKVDYRQNQNRPVSVNSYAPELKRRASVSGSEMAVTWECEQFRTTLNLTLKNSRVESSIQVDSLLDDVLIFNVTWPGVLLAPMDPRKDHMLHPFDQVIRNPAQNGFRVPNAAYYPDSHVPMQFCAYYDDRSGIYMAHEDPQGTVKLFYIMGKKNEMEISWQSYAPFAAGQTGKNSYKLSGVGALEVYPGEWYGAARIYRKFVSGKAIWWKEKTLQDMPERFLESPLWILTNYERYNNIIADSEYERFLYYKDYFAHSIGAHMYGWYPGLMPHFLPAYKDYPAYMKKLLDAGIYVKPYICSQLWAVEDGPGGKTDWQFSEYGKNYAVKNYNGSMNYESYRLDYSKPDPAKPFAVMCPAAPGWRDKYTDINRELIDMGSGMIYHDEMASAPPFVCFDPAHGHAMNDPRTWFNDGYLPMMKTIREINPGIAHDTEGFSEPYLAVMDGFLCWDPYENAPLAKTVYGSRLQITARHYGTWQFNAESETRFFIILAQQLAGAEQLGWFRSNEIIDYPNKMLYTKKMVHLRSGLMPYFNTGEMMPPLKYRKEPGTVTYFQIRDRGKPSHRDRIVSNAYIMPDNTVILLLLNSTVEQVKFQPVIDYPGKVLALCGEDSAEPEIRAYSGNYAPELTLGPLQTKIILIGEKRDEKFTAEAKRVNTLLSKIAGFKEPVPFENFGERAKQSALKIEPGKWNTADKVTAVVNAIRANDSVLWMEEGARIQYGIVDFGDVPFREIELDLVVAAGQKGGSIELFYGEEKVTAGTAQATASGTLKMKLDKPLAGRQQIGFRFSNPDCCTFKQWRVLK